jgi:hypothetical protein
MIDAIKQLQEALAYAQFADSEIKAAAESLLSELDTELTGESYEPGTAIEEAAARLHDAIEATDSAREEKKAEEKEEEEDQFAGLGDDEDEGVK